MNELKNNLILIGGGGHCRSCIDVIESENRYAIVGILDQVEHVGETVSGYQIIGADSDIEKYAEMGYSFLITVGHIGNASLRKKLYQQVLKYRGLFATVISPRAYIAKNSSVGHGSIVMHDVLINTHSVIAENCIINSKALIEHDCSVLADCHISTSAVLNGGVTVGEGTFFGSNAVSKQGVKIKENSFIKANSCFVTQQKKKKIAFLTTLFPTDTRYVIDFFESLSKQTLKYFDVIVLNDGYTNFNEIKKQFYFLNIIELPAAGSIAKNRQSLIQFSKVNHYEIAIFGDIDDLFSENRIENSVMALEATDIVVNDLTSIRDGQVIDKQIYSKRLTAQQLIPFDFIKDKNVFGMSNTAVNLNAVPLELIEFSDELIAVDWFFFSLLLLNGAKAQFVADSITFYRQYDANVIGIGEFSAAKIKSILAVKTIHYEKMTAVLPEYKKLLDETSWLTALSEDKEKLNQLLVHNRNKIKYPLWWELTSFRNEK